MSESVCVCACVQQITSFDVPSTINFNCFSASKKEENEQQPQEKIVMVSNVIQWENRSTKNNTITRTPLAQYWMLWRQQQHDVPKMKTENTHRRVHIDTLQSSSCSAHSLSSTVRHSHDKNTCKRKEFQWSWRIGCMCEVVYVWVSAMFVVCECLWPFGDLILPEKRKRVYTTTNADDVFDSFALDSNSSLRACVCASQFGSLIHLCQR